VNKEGWSFSSSTEVDVSVILLTLLEEEDDDEDEEEGVPAPPLLLEEDADTPSPPPPSSSPWKRGGAPSPPLPPSPGRGDNLDAETTFAFVVSFAFATGDVDAAFVAGFGRSVPPTKSNVAVPATKRIADSAIFQNPIFLNLFIFSSSQYDAILLEKI
jgi:hypothetical protein